MSQPHRPQVRSSARRVPTQGRRWRYWTGHSRPLPRPEPPRVSLAQTGLPEGFWLMFGVKCVSHSFTPQRQISRQFPTTVYDAPYSCSTLFPFKIIKNCYLRHCRGVGPLSILLRWGLVMLPGCPGLLGSGDSPASAPEEWDYTRGHRIPRFDWPQAAPSRGQAGWAWGRRLWVVAARLQ